MDSGKPPLMNVQEATDPMDTQPLPGGMGFPELGANRCVLPDFQLRSPLGVCCPHVAVDPSGGTDQRGQARLPLG